jgi:hypothetical protein
VAAIYNKKRKKFNVKLAAFGTILVILVVIESRLDKIWRATNDGGGIQNPVDGRRKSNE